MEKKMFKINIYKYRTISLQIKTEKIFIVYSLDYLSLEKKKNLKNQKMKNAFNNQKSGV